MYYYFATSSNVFPRAISYAAVLEVATSDVDVVDVTHQLQHPRISCGGAPDELGLDVG